VFDGGTVTILDDRFDYGEERFITFGLFDGRVVAVAHTETDTVIRMVLVQMLSVEQQEPKWSPDYTSRREHGSPDLWHHCSRVADA